MKETSWLLVANGSLAHLYLVENKTKIALIESFEHPESRLHNRDLVSDKPGRDFESTGATRHALTPRYSPKDQEIMEFARQLANFLEKNRTKEVFNQLYLVASPHVLGLLRGYLTSLTLKLIQGEIAKDLTQIPPDRLNEQLPFLL